MDREKLSAEKTEMQRQYVMVGTYKVTLSIKNIVNKEDAQYRLT